MTKNHLRSYKHERLTSKQRRVLKREQGLGKGQSTPKNVQHRPDPNRGAGKLHELYEKYQRDTSNIKAVRRWPKCCNEYKTCSHRPRRYR